MTLPRLGIDIGSTTIKVIWMTPGAVTRSIETVTLPVRTRGRRIIHPPESTLKRIRTIPDRFRFRGSWDAAIASQRSTFILWDRETGSLLTPLVSWRDRRGEQWINQLTARQYDQIHSVTGLRPEAGYPLSKIRWFLDHHDKVREHAERGRLCYGSLDTWLLWVATGGNEYFMDANQAHRTLLFDPKTNDWSAELMNEHDIPREMFPDIDSVDDPIPSENLWPNSRILTLIGDQPASTIGGQPPPYPRTRVTIGTAGFVASSCDPEDCPQDLTLSFAPTRRGRVYQAEGVVLSAGRAVDWLIRVFGITRDTFHSWIRPPWPEDIPLWCPSLNGVGAPFWSDRPASIVNFMEDTSAKHFGVGLVVSILQRLNDILREMPHRDRMRVLLDGGLTRIHHLPNLAAALWDLPVGQTLNPHITPRGAVIASHWQHHYFHSDPWDSLRVRISIPADVPVDRWNDAWQRSLDDWGLIAGR